MPKWRRRPCHACANIEATELIEETARSDLRCATVTREEIHMKMLAAFAISSVLGVCLLDAQQPPPSQQQPMSFFVTSVGLGNGANLGGLAGADRHCQALATGARVAQNVADLHGDTTEQARLGNNISKATALNEKGERNSAITIGWAAVTRPGMRRTRAAAAARRASWRRAAPGWFYCFAIN
jgi:hypothetical protein